MRFNNAKGEYPLPILRPSDFDSDYKDSDFQFDLSIDPDSKPHSFSIEHHIDNDDIKGLIVSGKASISLAVHCESTYLYELIDVSPAPYQIITFDEDKLFGDVYFTLVVKALEDVEAFKPSSLVSSLSGLECSVAKGDFLAISQEIKKFYGLPPLKLGADIFELEESPKLDSHAFEIGLSNPKIEIFAGTALNELVQFNMSTEQGRVRNISSVYFPALIDVLYQMKEGDHSGLAWFEAISEAMRRLGIDVDRKAWDPLFVAQQLLRFPYRQLLESS